MHGNARTFSEQVIPIITYESHFGMSDVAFRTAPPIARLLVIIIIYHKFVLELQCT